MKKLLLICITLGLICTTTGCNTNTENPKTLADFYAVEQEKHPTQEQQDSTNLLIRFPNKLLQDIPVNNMPDVGLSEYYVINMLTGTVYLEKVGSYDSALTSMIKADGTPFNLRDYCTLCDIQTINEVPVDEFILEHNWNF